MTQAVFLLIDVLVLTQAAEPHGAAHRDTHTDTHTASVETVATSVKILLHDVSARSITPIFEQDTSARKGY